MRTVVFGVGALGCYLAHSLCRAGNDVCVVARGAWSQTIAQDAITIHHVVQHRTTCDHPQVVGSLGEAGPADALFAVMQQGQMLAALPELAAAEAPLLVLVGNNLHVGEVQAYLSEHAPDKVVLFAFQSTAGRRESDHVECARWGATGLTVGPATGETPAQARALLDAVFAKGPYKPHYQHDMADWLLCHAAMVLPFVYLSYRIECDLTHATGTDIEQLTEATREAFEALGALGHEVLSKDLASLVNPGPMRALWRVGLRIVAKTSIGRLCVTDHCRAATHEMHDLDRDFMAIVDQLPNRAMPTWDAMRKAMPDWDELEERWNKKAN